jgi:Fibronectin type III domain
MVPMLKFKSILILVILSVFCSCVGTVQETSAPQNLEYKNPPTTFQFPGIISARAISHNKIEIEFYAASSQDEITYKLFINNSIVPLTIDPKTLLRVSGGKLLYTIDDLTADREYKLKIKAYNEKTAAISTNENEAYARTFDNVTADFNGISKISLLPGDTDGAILVDWIAPGMSGIFTAGPYDPVHYEVSLISEVGGIANLNNPLYFGTDKRIILVPTPPAKATPLANPSSVTIDGLAANTNYFVQVRAINSLYQDYATNPEITTVPVNREMNTRYMSIKTDSSGTLFDFRQDNVIVSNAPGIDAFDKIDVFWQPGSGSFSGYRIFVREYDGTGDPTLDDKLTETTLVNMNSLGNYFSVSSSFTSKRISALASYATYQVKVALCKSLECPVQSSDARSAIISDLKSIVIRPTLAPFSGINTIEPPGQYSERDVVKLRFDAPLIGVGYANSIEFYCVDPNDHQRRIRFDGSNVLSSTGIARCDGLYLDGTLPPISTHTSQKVRGLVSDGTREYCFAASPLITGYGPEIRLPDTSMIIRCSYPEVYPPTISQFPGIKNGCSVTGTSGLVSWNLPTGGIYSGFKVFWKEKSASNKFSFPHAIAGAPGYSSSTSLPASELSFRAENLVPGRSYQFGVLAEVDLESPAPDLFSEYNLNVVECSIPLPEATFNGFTRIFAVGPKTDGRVPNDHVTKAPANSSQLYEALDSNGIPYEVAMDTLTIPNLTENFMAPPGRDYGDSFSDGFDGAPELTSGYSMSKEGIISLAWEEVSLSFPEAETMFTSSQTPLAPRTGRNWGYKVYRSSDNKLSWQEITLTSRNIYSMNYTYRNRPSSTAQTRRMAFFTDYSVKALGETHDPDTGKDIERARTYFYRVVPVFDGKNIKYTSGTHHIVKVTLPPANMALVHRWMANRSHCLEYDKQPEIGNYYSCPYNGIGSRPQNIPYRVGDTKLDQGGDLLVDRHELGCRYTRGDRVSDPEVGASSFDLPDGRRRNSDDRNFFPLFRGYRTVSEIEDPTTPFKGCTGDRSSTKGTGKASDYPPGFVAEYNRLLQGDCIGTHGETIAVSTCTAAEYSKGLYSTVNVVVPGVGNSSTTAENCSESLPNDPTTLDQKLMGQFAPNEVMQSEFLAVFYNRYTRTLSSASYIPPVEGPATTSLSGSRTLTRGSDRSGYSSSQCTINLASIASDGYMRPRWISINDLGSGNLRFKNGFQNLLDKKVSELTEVKASTTEPLTFYNGTESDGTAANFKLPNSSLRNSSRYRSSTRMAKIFSSNASKLPPLGKVNPEIVENICQNYFVQTGVATDGGSFAPNMQPMPKRSLRRGDSITASAWPESFDSATILNIESANSPGSCINATRAIGSTGITKGLGIGNRSAVGQPGGTTLISPIPLLTGSSRYNRSINLDETEHSDKCISRFGIQDLVGNMSEVNSERFFCDYTQDQIFIGAVTSTWSGGSGAANQGSTGPGIPFFNNNSNNEVVLKSGNLRDGSLGYFEMRFRDGSPSRTDLKPWVKISADSGYCSIVDNNSSKRTGAVDFFKDPVTGYWNPLYLPGGSLNTSMIEKPQSDQEAVLSWRNGDGRFLDFGTQGIAAPFNTANTLSLSHLGITVKDGVAQSKYFNPLVGLPLRCSAGSCNDPLLNNPNDNTWITTSFLNGNIVPDAAVNDLPSITDFFVGNSQITHDGIADFDYSATGFRSMTVPDSTTYTPSFSKILQSVVVDDPDTMGNPVLTYKDFPADFFPGDTLDYFDVDWKVPRDTSFGISSGGAANLTTTGRYTASFVNSSFPGALSDNFLSGGRCAVLVNQED